jgi:uncharacterized protein (DUF983 family)
MANHHSLAFEAPSISRTFHLLGRALRLRCPSCGGGGLFYRWVNITSVCPTCGFQLEREHGYFLGAMAINIVGSEALFVALAVGVILLTWPTPPWKLLQYGSMALMVAFPLFFYPFAHTLWLAMDLAVRPAAPGVQGLDHPWPGAPSAQGDAR